MSETTVPTNKIFLLKRVFAAGYDEYIGKVVIAPDAKAARYLANIKYGEEGPIWINTSLVSCTEIKLDKSLIVLESLNAG